MNVLAGCFLDVSFRMLNMTYRGNVLYTVILVPQPMLSACDVPVTSSVAYVPSAANTSFDFNVPAIVVCL
jgi:hypothetical protein